MTIGIKTRSSSRLELLSLFKGRPVGLEFFMRTRSGRDPSAEIRLLQMEGLIVTHSVAIAPCYEITVKGLVYRRLGMMSHDQAGPWSIVDMRRFADMKQLKPDEIELALMELNALKLVTFVDTGRTVKWDII